ncbi:uridine kinase-like protein 1, chloroplastic [Juglans microcarpa x Juglans regia]|uniref:uridine kinase-like protein 1, chloroplastic n=1 Tax=Juglans microcarpa x Juglans regia TaxID=2249226 RepID=UPI001B7EB526|nr:uridine kinase-like protein 1, chloroplastic [Juglans microcarpa x Juglans regia]
MILRRTKMRRSSQQQRTTTDNTVRIEQDTPTASSPPAVSTPLSPPAQPSIPPKQALSNQPETPPKSATEPRGAPPLKSPEQPITTTPNEPTSGETQAPPKAPQLEPPKSPHEPSTPPPVDSSGHLANASPKLPFVIGVSGGTASGKTAVCNMIRDRLRNSHERLYDRRVVLISQDSFYRGRSSTEEDLKHAPESNFDDPDAFDKEKLLECIQKLKSGQSVQVPQYNFKKQCSDSYLQEDPCDVLILKGILLLQCQHVRGLLDMKVFIDTDADVRLARRIKRDTDGLGRNVTSVLEQYLKFVKPAFDTHIFPSRKHADFIIPNGVENHVAMDTILQQVQKKIGYHNLCYTLTNLNVIEPTYQTRCMHTLIRDKEISKHDFIFQSDRLIRQVVEKGLAWFPSSHFTEKQVTTPQGEPYNGLCFTEKLCGVSIDRSGEGMEKALRACCAEIDIGKILFLGPDQVHDTLPKDISERNILLLDPVLASGESAIQAIKLLKYKGVHESQIILLNIISAPEGIERVCKQFPALKVVTSEIDVGLNKQGKVIPGMGDFGGRYFGTHDC